MLQRKSACINSKKRLLSVLKGIEQILVYSLGWPPRCLASSSSSIRKTALFCKFAGLASWLKSILEKKKKKNQQHRCLSFALPTNELSYSPLVTDQTKDQGLSSKVVLFYFYRSTVSSTEPLRVQSDLIVPSGITCFGRACCHEEMVDDREGKRRMSREKNRWCTMHPEATERETKSSTTAFADFAQRLQAPRGVYF